MGIRGLYSYIQEYADAALIWHKLQNCKLVIDGNNLAYEIYNNSRLNTAYGGDYDKYATHIEKFFKKLIECKVEPIVVMDGGYTMQRNKFSTVYCRLTVQLESAMAVHPDNQDVMKIFPIMGRSVFVNVVQKLGVPVLQADFEADDEIAIVAKRLNAYVLSNDSDFYLFDVQFILLNSVNMKHIQTEQTVEGKSAKFIPCYRFDVHKFSKITGLRKELIPLLAPLLGNDFMNPKIMEGFHSMIASLRPVSKGIPYKKKIIISVIKWLAKQEGDAAEVLTRVIKSKATWLSKNSKDTLYSILDMYSPTSSQLKPWITPHKNYCPISETNVKSSEISDVFVSDFEPGWFASEDIRKELCCTCKKRVSNTFVTVGKMPDWFVRAFRQHLIPHNAVDILTKDYYFTIPMIECMELKSLYLRLEILIKKLRGLLWSTCAHGLSLKVNCWPNIENGFFMANLANSKQLNVYESISKKNGPDKEDIKISSENVKKSRKKLRKRRHVKNGIENEIFNENELTKVCKEKNEENLQTENEITQNLMKCNQLCSNKMKGDNDNTEKRVDNKNCDKSEIDSDNSDGRKVYYTDLKIENGYFTANLVKSEPLHVNESISKEGLDKEEIKISSQNVKKNRKRCRKKRHSKNGIENENESTLVSKEENEEKLQSENEIFTKSLMHYNKLSNKIEGDSDNIKKNVDSDNFDKRKVDSDNYDIDMDKNDDNNNGNSDKGEIDSDNSNIYNKNNGISDKSEIDSDNLDKSKIDSDNSDVDNKNDETETSNQNTKLQIERFTEDSKDEEVHHNGKESIVILTDKEDVELQSDNIDEYSKHMEISDYDNDDRSSILISRSHKQEEEKFNFSIIEDKIATLKMTYFNTGSDNRVLRNYELNSRIETMNSNISELSDDIDSTDNEECKNIGEDESDADDEESKNIDEDASDADDEESKNIGEDVSDADEENKNIGEDASDSDNVKNKNIGEDASNSDDEENKNTGEDVSDADNKDNKNIGEDVSEDSCSETEDHDGITKIRYIPPLRMFVRDRETLIAKTFGQESISMYKNYPTMFKIDTWTEAKRKNLFYKFIGFEMNLEENNLSSKVEFVLLCIRYWKENYAKHVDLDTILSVLMCVVMFTIIDEKIGCVRAKGSLEERFCFINKIQNKKNNGSLPDPSTLTISGLIQSLTVEECRLASLSLNQYHKSDPTVNRRNFDRLLVHRFSEYQASVYFLQYLNSLLYFPFPVFSMASIWSGTFCYNIHNCFSPKKELGNILSSLFSGNERISYLFLKLYSVLQTNFSSLPSFDDMKLSEVVIDDKIRNKILRNKRKLKAKKNIVKKTKEEIANEMLECDKLESPTEEDLVMLAENKFSALLIM